MTRINDAMNAMVDYIFMELEPVKTSDVVAFLFFFSHSLYYNETLHVLYAFDLILLYEVMLWMQMSRIRNWVVSKLEQMALVVRLWHKIPNFFHSSLTGSRMSLEQILFLIF